MSLFESTITGNILNDGQTTEVSGITAGQLATVLTAYTPLTDTAANTASIAANAAAAANNEAAVTALQAQVAALPPPPDLAPYALAADLAAAEGSLAANQSSLTALNTSLTTGLAGKANQSALDALQLEVDGKSTPTSVDTKLQAYSTTAAMNSAIASANNATLASVAATYGLKSTQDQLAIDLAAKQSGADVDQKIATALLPYTDAAGLAAAVALRTTPADVDQKLATALLAYVQQTALNAALAIRDGRLDAAEAAVAALQAAGYQTAAQVTSAIATALLGYASTGDLADYATAADLTAAETLLQSAIDAILAQLAALTTGGGLNLINAQAWPGEITWDLLLGTNTIRNLHASAPLSLSLQNDNFTLSLACDSYSRAEADALLAPKASESWMLATLGGYYTSAETNSVVTTALAPYSTTAQVDAAIAAALLPYSTTSETDAATAAAIAAALLPYSTTSETDAAAAAAIAAALLPYSTTSEMDAAITAALLQYYTATGVDNAIAAALVPYYTAAEVDSAISTAGSGITSVSNAPAWGANPPTWELLTGSLLRNLHFAGPLSGSLQNAGNTLQIDCDSYEKAETFTQAETNAAIAAAIDALNLNLYYTSAQTDTAITDALAPYYTSAQTDAAISSATGGFLTQAQGDSRYFLTTANFVGTRLVREDVTPPTLRTLLPRAPLSNNLISSNGTVELLCDCYSKSESDARYFPTSGNTSGGSIFEMILTGFTPRIIRAILPRPPLSGAAILGNGATLELNCDCWSKSEADGRYYTQAAADAAFAPMTTETGLQNLNLQVIDIDGRLATLEAGGGVPDPTITSAVHAPGGSVNLDLRAGTSSVRFFASDGTTQLANFSSNECFFDQPVRVDDQLTIDDVSGPAVGLLTNTVSARVGDSLLTLTGGTAGVRA